MAYFRSFPQVEYDFGDDLVQDRFQNIAIYADVVDQVKDAVTLYEDYYILPDERPDQVSYKFYESTEYYWTFFLANPKLREFGWPLSNNAMDTKAREIYSDYVITTLTKLTDKFKVGQKITGLGSGATATIKERNLDLGQLILKGMTGTFNNGETVSSVNANGVTETIVLKSIDQMFNVAHHYENADKEYVDIDPEVGPGAQLTTVTWLDRFRKQNDAQKSIRVIRSDQIRAISSAFHKAVKS